MGEIAIEEEWQAFREAILNWPEVEDGRMMSSPAVTRGGKVFAFPARLGSFPGLGLRIGRATNPDVLGLNEWEHLAPFKSKPPMKDWIVVGLSHRDRWMDLAQIAHDTLPGR